jgi:hypothetical protein
VYFFNWAIQAPRQFDPLIEIFFDELRSGPVVQMDEMRLQVMKESNPTGAISTGCYAQDLGPNSGGQYWDPLTVRIL